MTAEYFLKYLTTDKITNLEFISNYLLLRTGRLLPISKLNIHLQKLQVMQSHGSAMDKQMVLKEAMRLEYVHNRGVLWCARHFKSESEIHFRRS